MATVRRDLSSIVAHMRPVKREVRAELDQRADRVRAVVRAHRDTGALSRSYKVLTGKTDSHVFIEDPMIIPINYGHRAADGSWVEGIHAIEAGL